MQSVHVLIKTPPNPEPDRTLGVFAFEDLDTIKTIVSSFLENPPIQTEDPGFRENLRDEVLKLLSEGCQVLAVARERRIVTIHLKEKARASNGS